MKIRDRLIIFGVTVFVGIIGTAIISLVVWFVLKSFVVSEASGRFLSEIVLLVEFAIKHRIETATLIAITWGALACIEYRRECKYYALYCIESAYHASYKLVFQPRFVGSLIVSFLFFVGTVLMVAFFPKRALFLARAHVVGTIVSVVGLVSFVWICLHFLVSGDIGFDSERWNLNSIVTPDAEDEIDEGFRIRNARFENRIKRKRYNLLQCYLVGVAICFLLLVFAEKEASIAILINTIVFYANRCGMFEGMTDYLDQGYWNVLVQGRELYAIVLPNREFKSDLVVAVRVYYVKLQNRKIGAFLVLNQMKRFASLPAGQYLRLEYDKVGEFLFSVDTGLCSEADLCSMVKERYGNIFRNCKPEVFDG